MTGTALLLSAAPHHYRVSRTDVFGVGTGLLALTLGMRHAFDADHISAIDNTTRSLMGGRNRPLSVGFFFALGHSTVVFALAVALGVGVGVRALDGQVQNASSSLHHVITLVGTLASGAFLYVIAALNVVVLISIYRAFVAIRHEICDEAELELERQLQQRGLMNRFFGPLARRIDSPAKIYRIGVLFGLGFDTATEVALLVLSGTAVASGLSFWAVLSLPLLFAGGMTLFDTLDGCLMNFAYGWAFARPVRKVYYYLVITALSVAVAALIGTIELVGLLASELHLTTGPWPAASSFDINAAGFVIVGLFAATGVLAALVWRFGRLDERWTAGTSAPAVARLGAAAHESEMARDGGAAREGAALDQYATSATAKPS